MSLTLQYAFTSHPSFEEDGDAAALRIEVGCAPPPSSSATRWTQKGHRLWLQARRRDYGRLMARAGQGQHPRRGHLCRAPLPSPPSPPSPRQVASSRAMPRSFKQALRLPTRLASLPNSTLAMGENRRCRPLWRSVRGLRVLAVTARRKAHGQGLFSTGFFCLPVTALEAGWAQEPPLPRNAAFSREGIPAPGGTF